MRPTRTALGLALILTLSSGALVAPAAAQTPSVRSVLVKGNLQNPAGFTFDRDGRIWYIEKDSGEIRVLTPSTGRDRLFFDIPGVNAEGERGGLGVALHPEWPATPYVYAYVTRTGSGGALQNQVLSIRADGGVGVGWTVLLRWNVTSARNHNGGRILFGPDGNLWIVTGENANPANSQDLANVRGKILRIRPNGQAPSTNPFGTRVWAYGIRNSFGMAFDPTTGRLWETENGPACNDEINLILKGGNYAWGPSYDCPTNPTAADTNADGPAPRRFPKYVITDTIGITGAAFCVGCGLGASVHGDLLFADVNTAWIRALDLTADRTGFVAGSRRDIVRMPTAVYSMERAPDGRIYVSGPTGIWRLAPAT
jgi:glucose/arabinose dehydrogenase